MKRVPPKVGDLLYFLNRTENILEPVKVDKVNIVTVNAGGHKYRIEDLKRLNRYQVAEINRHLADLCAADEMLGRVWGRGEPCAGITLTLKKS